jgi:hypothetical protein
VISVIAFSLIALASADFSQPSLWYSLYSGDEVHLSQISCDAACASVGVISFKVTSVTKIVLRLMIFPHFSVFCNCVITSSGSHNCFGSICVLSVLLVS